MTDQRVPPDAAKFIASLDQSGAAMLSMFTAASRAYKEMRKDGLSMEEAIAVIRACIPSPK